MKHCRSRSKVTNKEKARNCGGVGGGIDVLHSVYLSMLGERERDNDDDDNDDDDNGDDDDDDDGGGGGGGDDDDDDGSVSLVIYGFGQKAVRDLTVTAGDVDPHHNCK